MGDPLGIKELAGFTATGAQASSDAEGKEFFIKEKGSNASTEIVNNNTLLKQTVSLMGAGVSVFSNLAFGVKVPVYEGTLGDRLINPITPEKEREALTSIEEAEAETGPKISALHNVTRNIANAVISVVNVPLFIATRSTLSTFEATPPEFVTGLKAYAKSKALNVYAWYDEHKDQPTNTGKIIRAAETAAKGVNHVHEAWGNLLRSKAVYHTLNVGVGITTLGFMGPPGWAIAAGIVAVDITRGAVRVNRIQVRQDELAHLNSLNQSKKRIDSLKHAHSADFLKELGEPILQKSTPSISSPEKTKDELDQAASKALRPTLLKEGISIGVAGMNAAVNHVGFAVATTLAFLSWGTNTKAKLSEQDAKDSLRNKTDYLYKETDTQRNPKQSRQYDLAKAAYEHTVYAKALELATDDKTKNGRMEDTYEYKAQAEMLLKKDPEFQKLFHPDKMEKPSLLSSIYHGAKTATLSTLDYLHPLKEATTYEKAHADFVEKEVKLKHATQQHSTDTGKTPTPPVHNQQAELMAKKERGSLTSHGSTSERYSETTPLINRSRSRDSEYVR